jgi:hypothetical protein
MLDAYADYLRALAHPDPRARASRDARAARTARTNAQASLDRMRAEPATPLTCWNWPTPCSPTAIAWRVPR